MPYVRGYGPPRWSPAPSIDRPASSAAPVRACTQPFAALDGALCGCAARAGRPRAAAAGARRGRRPPRPVDRDHQPGQPPAPRAIPLDAVDDVRRRARRRRSRSGRRRGRRAPQRAGEPDGRRRPDELIDTRPLVDAIAQQLRRRAPTVPSHEVRRAASTAEARCTSAAGATTSRSARCATPTARCGTRYGSARRSRCTEPPTTSCELVDERARAGTSSTRSCAARAVRRTWSTRQRGGELAALDPTVAAGDRRPRAASERRAVVDRQPDWLRSGASTPSALARRGRSLADASCG